MRASMNRWIVAIALLVTPATGGSLAAAEDAERDPAIDRCRAFCARVFGDTGKDYDECADACGDADGCHRSCKQKFGDDQQKVRSCLRVCMRRKAPPEPPPEPPGEKPVEL